jgi:hypothetical protein
MRKWIAGLTVAAVAACSGGERLASDLDADLAVLSSASALELASGPANAAAVVSAQEQTAPRATTQAPSARAPRPRPSPAPTVRAAPRPEPQAEPQVDYAAATPQPQPLPQPTENRGFDGMGEEAVVTGRPQVVDAAPVSRGGGGGSEIGAVLGGIGIAVIRGGVVFGDVHCPPPRRRARDGGPLALPNRSGSGGVQMTVRGITIR